MKGRCYRPSMKYSGRYEDRGITVCDEWKNDFMAFYHWCINNGYSEELDLDRRDNDLGYSPDNCRFVTRVVNSNNKEDTIIVNYNGKEIALSLLVRDLGLTDNLSAIRHRIARYGWNLEDALTKPIRKCTKHSQIS